MWSYVNQEHKTSSKYRGIFNNKFKCMDGFGCYTYPNGSEYRGYFSDGQFHGFGSLKVSVPFPVIIKGSFNKGRLIEIESMIFSDGVNVKDVWMEGDKLNADRWRFCTDQERRYQKEFIMSLQPVGPESYLTPNRPSRKLMAKTYDTEEGIYTEATGFIGRLEGIDNYVRFVGCKKEANWIIKNCRKGVASEAENRMEPDPDDGRRILINNIESMNSLNEPRVIPDEKSNGPTYRKDYCNVCPRKLSMLADVDSDSSADLPAGPSSASSDVPSSFDEVKPEYDLRRRVALAAKFLKRGSSPLKERNDSLVSGVISQIRFPSMWEKHLKIANRDFFK